MPKLPRNRAAKAKRRHARRGTEPKERRPAPPPEPKVRPRKGELRRRRLQVWQPGDALEEDEELDFDASAYDCLVRFTDTWPALSFEFVPDLAQCGGDFPHSVYFVAGTQAVNSRDNYIGLTKIKGVKKLPRTEDCSSSSSDSDSPSDDDSDNSDCEKETFCQQRLRHVGGINRVRVLPQDPRFVAVWSDQSAVQVYDVTASLNLLREDRSSTEDLNQAPLFSRKHRSEGWALDWSSVKQGVLASGDCQSGLNVWEPQEEGQWNILACQNGHSASVEDIQWSPTEATVFASGSVDKSIKIWDTRNIDGARLSVSGSATDINVLSWNRGVTYMLASGDDAGALKIWDLRKFAEGECVAEFGFHKRSLTSVEWCPHESSMLATSADDDQVAVWDLALERDPEEEAQFASAKNAQLPPDVPPQLLFLHSGQKRIKELHWHPQIQGAILSTAEDGMHLFKPANL